MMESKVKFSHEKPPVYEKCHELFGAEWDRGVVITYGDTVFSKNPISDDLIAHESVHVRQQTDMGKDIWWDRYFVDADFRLSQEVEAYKVQIAYAREHYERPHRRALEKHIYKSMAHMYGKMCTEEEAKQLLQ